MAEDTFATSKANLRDTVKWLATTIAALAALVVAGAPFSAFGQLEPMSVRFLMAAGGLLVAGGCLLLVWLKLLRMLRSDAVFPVQIRSAYSTAGLDSADAAEIEALRAHLARHRADLLPTGVATFDELETVVADEWAAASATPTNPALMARYKGYADNAEMYVNYATFARLHERIAGNTPSVIALTATAVIALFGFAYAANPPKPAALDRIVVVQNGATPPVESPPQTPPLGPVQFKPNSSRLDQPALQAISAARTYLRGHETMGMVLLAHTDTTGSESRNSTLAAERGTAVRSMLLREGGMAPSRVFVAELPKADLPNLTLPQVSDADNRSVEFLIVTMAGKK